MYFDGHSRVCPWLHNPGSRPSSKSNASESSLIETATPSDFSNGTNVPFSLHRLGKDGPKVPALGFGLMNIAHLTYGSIPGDEERLQILDPTLELGDTFWDTELGVAIVVLAPLERGLITSTFGSGKAAGDSGDRRPEVMPRFQEANREHNVNTVTKLVALADEKRCSVSQLSLAWLRKQGDDIFPISGTKRLKYLEENWASLDVSLTDEDDAKLKAFSEANELAGWHSTPQFAPFLFRDTKEEAN